MSATGCSSVSKLLSLFWLGLERYREDSPLRPSSFALEGSGPVVLSFAHRGYLCCKNRDQCHSRQVRRPHLQSCPTKLVERGENSIP